MKKVLYIFVGIDLLLINALIVYLLGKQFAKVDSSIDAPTQVMDSNSTTDIATEELECPLGCMSLFNNFQKNEEDESIIPPPTTAPLKATTPVRSVVAQKVKSTNYFPIPGSGNTSNTQWTDIVGTDFYMSTADYPGLVGVYFEANIKLLNGNGSAFVRLYDVTNSRGVDKSTLSTDSQTSVFVSDGPISLWSGYNQYRIQAKSLTADTTYFESGRLKIITEN